MINSKIVEDESVTISSEKAHELRSYELFDGDIVMARRGEMGRCALVTKRESGWLCGTGSFILRFHHDLSREFVLLLFRTDWIRSYLGGKSIGATMTNLNHGILNKMPILLPPINEQNRIIGRVDQLTAICDQLKTSLAEIQKNQIDLTNALIDQAVG